VLAQSQEKYREVFQVAENLYRQDPDWVTFFREVLGIEGAVRRGFPSFDELTRFEQSEEYENIQKMLVKLREKRTTTDTETEPTRVITVRLPKSMHEYLRTEAHDLRTSMNKLCISKLLLVIGEEMIPNESTATGSPASNGNGAPVATQSAPRLAQPVAAHQPQTSTPIAQPHLAPSPFKPSQPRF
jgi:predicted HicB family RNase H-like nuclease